MRVYLDTSALNRIFDDQTQPRVFLEASAMLLVFALIDASKISLVSSEVSRYENANNPYRDRREFVAEVLKVATLTIVVDEDILRRSQKIEPLTIKGIDALHLSCAERADCKYFITCDDKLIRKYRGSMKVTTPTGFITE